MCYRLLVLALLKALPLFIKLLLVYPVYPNCSFQSTSKIIALCLFSFSILAEDSLAVSSFEAIANSLHQRFNKNEHFQIGCAMV